MCLLVLSYSSHERYRLVFAGNRDELHARPAQPAHWWSEDDRLLAGRDLEAGGTWLGMTRTGRFAVVTNYRDPGAAAGALSRGTIVSDYLRSDLPAERHAARLHAGAASYSGFSAILVDAHEAWFVSNRDAPPRRLEPGLYGLSNELIDVPWPKVVRAKAALAEVLGAEVTTDALLELLDDRPQASSNPPALPDFERIAASIFVAAGRYGTRCSTAITVTHDGAVEFAERSFDARGATTGTERFRFDIEDRSDRAANRG